MLMLSRETEDAREKARAPLTIIAVFGASRLLHDIEASFLAV